MRIYIKHDAEHYKHKPKEKGLLGKLADKVGLAKKEEIPIYRMADQIISCRSYSHNSDSKVLTVQDFGGNEHEIKAVHSVEVL